jgi:hypothetical protein
MTAGRSVSPLRRPRLLRDASRQPAALDGPDRLVRASQPADKPAQLRGKLNEPPGQRPRPGPAPSRDARGEWDLTEGKITDGHGSETRQRQIVRTMRLTGIEDALLRARADHAGLPVSTFLRCVALEFPLPRAARRPTANQKLAAVLLGELCRTADAFNCAATLLDRDLAEQAARDFAEYRLVLLLALGMKP